MKLISLNVGLFEDNNEKLKAFIRTQNPDFLALQEVTRSVESAALAEYVSKPAIDTATANLGYGFYGPLSIFKHFEQQDFHGKEKFVFDLHGGVEFGNYIKSRYEIVWARNIFVQNCFTFIKDMTGWPETDYRAVEVVDMVVGDKKLRILNYHGIWTKNKLGNELALKACEQIRVLALEVDYPAIICGDFNLFPKTAAIKVFDADFKNLPNEFNIKTTRPPTNELHDLERNVVDYVLISTGVTVKSFRVIDTDVSDHLPLVMEFEL